MVREIGPALTKELVLTCRPFDAAGACAMGFLNRVVSNESLEDEVEDLARSLVKKAKKQRRRLAQRAAEEAHVEEEMAEAAVQQQYSSTLRQRRNHLKQVLRPPSNRHPKSLRRKTLPTSAGVGEDKQCPSNLVLMGKQYV